MNEIWKHIERGKYHEMENFLESGNDVNLRNSSQESLLHRAVAKDKLKIAKLLLQYKIDVDAQDADQHTALIDAAFKNDVEMVDLLLNDGNADPNIQDDQGKTALHYACLGGFVECMRKIAFHHSTNTEIKDNSGMTAYDLAFRSSQMKSIDAIMHIRYKGRSGQHGDKSSEVSNYQQVRRFIKQCQPHQPDLKLENLVLIKPDDFLSYGRIPHFDVCREKGWHRPGDVMNTSKTCLFISHRWEAREEPDPSNRQFEMIYTFLEHSPHKYDYMWVDYSCIIQDTADPLFQIHLKCISLAIFTCTHTLILPKLTISSDKPIYSDLKDYLDRGWCQMEALTCMITGTASHCYFNYGDEIGFGARVNGDDMYDEDLHESGDVFKGSALFALNRVQDKERKKQIREEVDSYWFDIRESSDFLCDAVDCLLTLKDKEENGEIFDRMCTMSLTSEDLEADDQLYDFSQDIGDLNSEDDRVIIVNILLFLLAYCMAYLPDMPRKGSLLLEQEVEKRYTTEIKIPITVFSKEDSVSSIHTSLVRRGSTQGFDPQLPAVASEDSLESSFSDASEGGDRESTMTIGGEEEQKETEDAACLEEVTAIKSLQDPFSPPPSDEKKEEELIEPPVSSPFVRKCSNDKSPQGMMEHDLSVQSFETVEQGFGSSQNGIHSEKTQKDKKEHGDAKQEQATICYDKDTRCNDKDNTVTLDKSSQQNEEMGDVTATAGSKVCILL